MLGLYSFGNETPVKRQYVGVNDGKKAHSGSMRCACRSDDGIQQNDCHDDVRRRVMAKGKMKKLIGHGGSFFQGGGITGHTFQSFLYLCGMGRRVCTTSEISSDQPRPPEQRHMITLCNMSKD